MRPAKFDYQRPSSVAEAIKMLSSSGGAKALAGGHESGIPALNLRLAQPDALVDIGRLSELKGISASGGKLSIGALSTHAEIAASADVKAHCAALASACANVGDPQVRNWGLLCDGIAHADPSSDPPTVLLAAGGTVHIQGTGGSRSVAASDFFVDLFTTALADGELITRIEIPSLQGKKSAYVKMTHPASRYAVLGICVVLGVEGGKCSSASVAIGGCVPKATKSAGAEAALKGSSLDDQALDAAANALMSDIASAVTGDIYAPEKYRKQMAGVYLKRAVRAALA
ncbi:MAG: xanthine dehydrogenase family protein subunit M [Anaerolineae bacterium]